METLYDLFKKSGEYRFPFELLEHFDLESVRELGDLASARMFHEIFLREKQGEASPAVYIRRSFHDNPMQGIPTLITIQRNLSFIPAKGLAYCNNYTDRVAKLDIHADIKQFLSDDYQHAEANTRTRVFGRQIA